MAYSILNDAMFLSNMFPTDPIQTFLYFNLVTL